jgi:hypothetical protein
LASPAGGCAKPETENPKAINRGNKYFINGVFKL